VDLVQLQPGVDATALERELRRQLEGEVRFDAISRALYSTDASVYRIRPLGVVIPKSRKDIMRTVESVDASAVHYDAWRWERRRRDRLSAKGFSRYLEYYNRVAGSECGTALGAGGTGCDPGRTECGAGLAGLRFAPDISTASRATIRGIDGQQFCGARSVIYGKTIDHVLEQTVLAV